MGENENAWAFSPDWLVAKSEKKDAIVEELSTCPSWLTVENAQAASGFANAALNRTLRSTVSMGSRVNRAGRHSSVKSSESSVVAAHEDPNEVTLMLAKLRYMEKSVKHNKGQTTFLRNELHSARATINSLNSELSNLHEHIHYLRHITSPTIVDVGALDASLSMLRGHELQKARARENDISLALRTSETAREQLVSDLENERKQRSLMEESLNEEIQELHLRLSKASILNNARQNKLQAVDHRYHNEMIHFQEENQKLKNGYESSLMAIRAEAEKETTRRLLDAEEHFAKRENAQRELNAVLQERVQNLSKQLAESQDQLTFAIEEVRGMEGLRGVGTENDLSVELEKQRVALVKNFEQERNDMKREIRSLSNKLMNLNRETLSKADAATDTDDLDQQLLKRLHAYHNQLQRATTELKHAAQDNKILHYKFVASLAARVALQKAFQLSSRQSVFQHKTKLKEVQDSNTNLSLKVADLEQLLSEAQMDIEVRERQLCFRAAAQQGAERVMSTEMSKCRQENANLVVRLSEAEAVVVELNATITTLSTDLDLSNASLKHAQLQLSEAESSYANLDAELLLVHNECLRLSSEVARVKMQRKTKRRVETRDACFQTDLEEPKDSRDMIWEHEKRKELSRLQRRYAASFKKQVANFLASGGNIPPVSPNSEQSSLSSSFSEKENRPSRAHLALQHQDEQPSSEKITQRMQARAKGLNHEPIPLQDDETVRIPQASEKVENTPQSFWTPEQSLARWKRRSQRTPFSSKASFSDHSMPALRSIATSPLL